MKRTLKMMAMLLCVASLATFSSCSKDNSDNQGGSTNQLSGISQQVLGRWTIASSDFSVYLTTNTNVEFAYKVENGHSSQIVYCNGSPIGGWQVADNILDIAGWYFEIQEITNSSLVLEETEEHPYGRNNGRNKIVMVR